MLPPHLATGLLATAVAAGLYAWSRRRAARARQVPSGAAAAPPAAQSPASAPAAPAPPVSSRRVDGEAVGENLLDVLHDAVYSISPDHRILAWNAAAERIFGFDAYEVLGRTVAEVLRIRTVTGEPIDGLVDELEGPGHLRRELKVTRRDGTELFVEGSVVAIRDRTGVVTGYVVVNRDVSERRRAEEALRASEAKFRAAFHGAGLAMALIDEHGKLREYNRAFREMLGYSDAELENRTIASLTHPDDLARQREELNAARRQTDVIVGERRYRRSDGEYVDALLRASTVRDTTGRFLYSVGLIEDVTQKKQLEAHLVFADRMSSIGTLAAGVAHEINNPLAFILSNLNFIGEELSRLAQVPAEVVEAIAETREGAVRVREIVRDLKTFSRADDLQVDEPLDVRAVLQTSLKLTQNELRHRARLVLDLHDVPRVSASPHRLGQVFVNLLLNAAQAIGERAPDQNEIRVRCDTGANGSVVVEVTDTGRGIPRENLSRIFEPFFTTKPFGVGTGLGLSICHGIVTRLGGTIQVETQVGRGSTFRVTLPPVTAGDAPAPESAPPAAVPRSVPEVLVVDDEPMIGTAVARTLGGKHRVTSVTSARAALAHIHSSAPIDVVVCDLMMPEMTGMDLHATLRETHPGLARRMVFLTGGAFTSQTQEFLDRVPNARLDKPFDAEALRAAVSEVVATGR